MSVTLIDDDLAEVTNHAYDDDPDEDEWDHTYLVEIDPTGSPKGEPIACSCPSHSYTGAYCKHMGKTKRVLLGLDAPDDVLTDGGTPCPHEHPDCEGYPHSPRDRPILCGECWDEWAAYDPDDYLLPEEERYTPDPNDNDN